MSASSGAGMYTVNSPITQSGRVVYNAQKDTFSIQRRRRTLDRNHSMHYGSEHDTDECYSVLAHELAMFDNNRDFAVQRRDNRIPIITSANGLYHAGENHELSRKTESTISFLGVASSRAIHNESNAAANEDDCTVQCGGLCTVVNNGDRVIRAGDWVCWDFPTKDNNEFSAVQGTPANKQTFRIVSEKNLTLTYTSGVSGLRFDADDEVAMNQLLLGSIEYNSMKDLVRSRVIGRAMSSGDRGAMIDILLGSLC